jgi:ABC-2 type transport system ATP-binding protein
LTIEIRNLSKKINNNLIFENLSFDFSPGTIYGIIGKNGTGKTTFLKLLSGLIPDDKRRFTNLYPNHYSPIGIHLESPKLYPYLSGKQNIHIFTSDLLKSYYEPNSLINDFKLENLINKKTKTYSMGTKQKISLIIAILMSNKLLLLDEPTNGLDEETIQTLKKILLHLSKKYGVTVIITTHDLLELEEIFNEILTIKNNSLEEVDWNREKEYKRFDSY